MGSRGSLSEAGPIPLFPKCHVGSPWNASFRLRPALGASSSPSPFSIFGSARTAFSITREFRPREYGSLGPCATDAHGPPPATPSCLPRISRAGTGTCVPFAPAAPAPRGGPRRSPQRRPAALQDRPAPTPARQQRSSRCRPPNSPTTRPRRPRPQRLAPAVMIRTLGCLPALIRPPFRCSTVPLQARARNGTTTATLRVIYPATNLGPGRATQHGTSLGMNTGGRVVV